MGERTTPRRLVVFAVVDWLVRLIVPLLVVREYGLLAGFVVGVALVAASEVSWRLLAGEWGNLWPSRLILARRRRAE